MRRIGGAEGPDTLNGRAGNDILVGGAGLDAMNGCPDTDHCIPGFDGGTSVDGEDD